MLHTLLFNRSDRARFQFSGAQITATLNGLVTNDVALLAPGQGQFAGILTPKSKILADVRIFMGPVGVAPDGYLMDTSPATADSVRDFLKKYLNPRFAKHTDITDTTCHLGIFGDGARDIVAKAASIDSDALSALAPYGHTTGVVQGVSVAIVRTPELDVEGYDIIAPKEHESTLIDLLTASGATVADATQWKAMRTAIGWPEWGVDMDDSTLPQEANFDELHALSHSKGCYIGHETIARIHFRGHVNKKLRRLSFSGPDLPPRGAELTDDAGKSVGTVTSTTVIRDEMRTLTAASALPPDGTLAGIGMVRREIEDGTTLTVAWDGATATATILGIAKGAVD